MSPPPARRATSRRAGARPGRPECTSTASRSARPAGSCRTTARASRPTICTRAGATISTGMSSWRPKPSLTIIVHDCGMQIDPAPASNHGPGNARLLIVEPNRSALTVLAKRLGELGYRVIACDNAGNAAAEMLRLPVDLVLAELRMASVSGVELTRRIRDDTLLKETPVILITGKT